MKKDDYKTIHYILIITLCILLCPGCSPAQQAAVASEKPEIILEVQIPKQPDADITIPSVLVGDELSQVQLEDGTATDNGDGSVTYSLKGGEIDGILQQIAANLSDSIQDILDDDDYYPNVTAITPSDDYTSFTIALSDGQMNIYESMLVMSFYTIGNRYQIYSGVPAGQAVTTVIYINDADNTVISKTDSTSVETFSPQ